MFALVQAYTSTRMDGECAFCGRAESATRQVFCGDCQAQHRVCVECADEAARELEAAA
jgi:hypothetical protein